MPHTTIVKPEFGELVKNAVGSLSYMQASYKTGLSAEYIRMMVNGRVPSESAIVKLAEGLGADLHELRVAAGYEAAADPVDRVQYALNGAMLDATQLKRIEELLRKHRKPNE